MAVELIRKGVAKTEERPNVEDDQLLPSLNRLASFPFSQRRNPEAGK